MITGKKIFAAHNTPFQKAHTEDKEDGVTLSLNGSSLLLLANPEWTEFIISSLRTVLIMTSSAQAPSTQG